MKTAIILAGGLGTRLQPFTQIMPKPLLPIGERSVLEIQIERLKKFGFTKIFFATNYKADYIARFFGDGSQLGVELHYSKEEEPLGTVGPLSLIRENLTEPFVVMNGDILSLVNYEELYQHAIQSKCNLTVAVKKHVMPFAFGDIIFEGDRVIDIEEKPDIVKYILAGIYVMSPKVLEYVPDNTYFGMDTLIKTMIAENDPISKYELTDYWLDIGQIDDFQKANNTYAEYFKPDEE